MRRPGPTGVGDVAQKTHKKTRLKDLLFRPINAQHINNKCTIY
jgi:hypothetical protein